MTEREALATCIKFVNFGSDDVEDVVVKALKKQIAKKLVGGFKCASCNNDVTETYYHIDYCPFCGQKLDWSEV